MKKIERKRKPKKCDFIRMNVKEKQTGRKNKKTVDRFDQLRARIIVVESPHVE